MTDTEGKFLGDVPSEIREVLDWYSRARVLQAPDPEISEFASKFLGGMLDDGAVFPRSSTVTPAQTLALVLVHHRRSSGEDPGAWLNLGIALRRMALYRTQDSESVNRRRLQLALEAFDRCLRLEPGNIAKNIRAWTGKAFTYHQLGLYDEEVSCCSRALNSDRSDPKLWLFYGFALKATGRKSEALSAMDNAYETYVAAGEPEDLRDVFAGVRTALPRC